LGALVIASQEEKVLWVLDLVAEEQSDCLDRLLATVDVVTKEQVVCFGRETTVFKNTE